MQDFRIYRCWILKAFLKLRCGIIICDTSSVECTSLSLKENNFQFFVFISDLV